MLHDSESLAFILWAGEAHLLVCVMPSDVCLCIPVVPKRNVLTRDRLHHWDLY